MINCLNCQTAIEGNFCLECGQKSKTHRFTLHEWLHEIPHSIFHIDSGFLYTFRSLYSRPGNMILEYLQGRRKVYFSPFLYVLIWCGVFIVVSHFIDGAEHQEAPVTDLKTAVALIENQYYKILVVAMILPLSISSYLIFFRKKYNFAEHLVLNSFVIGQLIIADIVMAIVGALHLKTNHRLAVNLFEFSIKFPIWVWTYFQFFKPKNIILGIVQILFCIILGSVLTSLMVSGAAYMMLLFHGSSH